VDESDLELESNGEIVIEEEEEEEEVDDNVIGFVVETLETSLGWLAATVTNSAVDGGVAIGEDDNGSCCCCCCC
jgi:hypothetical protein